MFLIGLCGTGWMLAPAYAAPPANGGGGAPGTQKSGQVVPVECPVPPVPVNRSTEMPPEFFDNQVLASCDPYCPDGDNDYCQQGGTRRGSPGSSGASITTNVSKARMDCPATKKMDSTCEVEYPDCTGKPGGLSAQGATSVCQKGEGDPTEGVQGILEGIFPGFGDGFIDCLTDFIGGLNFNTIGGFIGSFVNGVTVAGNVDVGRDGLCGGGSVGFCGFTVGGEICVLDEMGDAVAAYEEGVSFVEAYAPGIIQVGTDIANMQGPIIAVDGGFLEGYGEVEPGEIVQTFVNQAGQTAIYVFPAGTKVAEIAAGTAVGVRADAEYWGGTRFTRAFTMYGLTRIPAENVVGGAADDKDRVSEEIADHYIYAF